MNSDPGYGRARPERGLFAHLHDYSATPSAIDPLEAGPLVTGTRLRGRFAAMRDVVETRSPGLPRKSPLSPKAPFARNLNTGRIATNSRFFSDCYSYPKPETSRETGT